MTTLARALTFAGLLCLAAITLASPGATRMWATPWTLALWAALLLPALALIVRALDSHAPLALPAAGWRGCALGFACIVLASALASPYPEMSLRWSAPLLGGVALFFLIFDALHGAGSPGAAQERRTDMVKWALAAAFVIAFTSVGLWLLKMAQYGVTRAVAGRNPYPLGHANYTAGLALLMLPLAVCAGWRDRGVWRAIASVTAGLALIMLFSSGSRGGLLGLAVFAAAALWQAPVARRTKAMLGLAVLGGGLVFIVANPRMRAAFGGAERDLVASSDLQRTAMFSVGKLMGADRPLLGWGPGTTPLVYPRYRASVNGGADTVLQLHCAPVQLWAELGVGGLVALLALALLVIRDGRRAPLAAFTLGGYAIFALTDWQLDVPIFATAFAGLLAAVARPASAPLARLHLGVLAAFTTAGVALIAGLGGRDPAPELNIRALALAREPANANRAIALLRESLSLNPDQEIVHFNLGWLLVVRDPVAAERHFRAAARLVPDKGGVYFGIGLARLNQDDADAAARALALECINDPIFLTSPWLKEPSLAPLHARMLAAVEDISHERTSRLDLYHPIQVLALAQWLERLKSAEDLARYIYIPEAKMPSVRAARTRIATSPPRAYRRERTGYPVLMRNLDLPPPLDLFDVRENVVAVDEFGFLFPSKGSFSHLMLQLLAAKVPAKP